MSNNIKYYPFITYTTIINVIESKSKSAHSIIRTTVYFRFLSPVLTDLISLYNINASNARANIVRLGTRNK